MEIQKSKIEGLYLTKPKIFYDERGKFVKTFHKQTFIESELDTDFVENYYSLSNKNVIRGMHFQIPPADHNKLVYVPAGKINDVVLDIRKKSKSFGKFETFELNSQNNHCLFIPKGCAHGFISIEDNTIVTYMQTSMYNKKCDKGIRYDSFGFNWNCENPILSERDKNFPDFEKYKSPF